MATARLRVTRGYTPAAPDRARRVGIESRVIAKRRSRLRSTSVALTGPPQEVHQVFVRGVRPVSGRNPGRVPGCSIVTGVPALYVAASITPVAMTDPVG